MARLDAPASAEIRARKRLDRPSLKIGCGQAWWPLLVRRTVDGFRRPKPDILLHIEICSSFDGLRHLMSGDVHHVIGSRVSPIPFLSGPALSQQVDPAAASPAVERARSSSGQGLCEPTAAGRRPWISGSSSRPSSPCRSCPVSLVGCAAMDRTGSRDVQATSGLSCRGGGLVARRDGAGRATSRQTGGLREDLWRAPGAEPLAWAGNPPVQGLWRPPLPFLGTRAGFCRSSNFLAADPKRGHSPAAGRRRQIPSPCATRC
ncbi:hypothetical protein SAMN05421539_103380 [Jannaschia seohaensis]|uniref:Uncharacterized protein n=1 Tax=Jannaschia seohaensis TaxID=475081 RepID=A0A2Y9AQC5_9RHOB|nr:hypothetical protein BCF38_103380 [Jannaschia seohaensis]SSA44657.1 hypothetical protein SAMN05421539_103380 [Jannaschia seohaensis]